MIETFVSRPNWAPQDIETGLTGFYQLLADTGFKANTIGKSQAALRTPFEDVRRLIKKCQCTIVLGLPQIFMEGGSIKQVAVTQPLTLATEWNQIEATMSLMLDLPTLVLRYKSVTDRGVFERGAANLFVYEFNALEPDWLQGIRPALRSLKDEVGA